VLFIFLISLYKKFRHLPIVALHFVLDKIIVCLWTGVYILLLKENVVLEIIARILGRRVIIAIIKRWGAILQVYATLSTVFLRKEDGAILLLVVWKTVPMNVLI